MATTYVGGDKTTRATSSMAERAYEGATDRVGKVTGAVEAGVDKVKNEADGVVRVANDINSTVRASLKDQPMTTLAIAAGIGFVLGAIWKS